MAQVVPVFRLPEKMTGTQAKAWIAPEHVSLITGPPFDPEAWSALQKEEKILLDTDPEMQYPVEEEENPNANA